MAKSLWKKIKGVFQKDLPEEKQKETALTEAENETEINDTEASAEVLIEDQMLADVDQSTEKVKPEAEINDTEASAEVLIEDQMLADVDQSTEKVKPEAEINDTEASAEVLIEDQMLADADQSTEKVKPEAEINDTEASAEVLIEDQMLADADQSTEKEKISQSDVKISETNIVEKPQQIEEMSEKISSPNPAFKVSAKQLTEATFTSELKGQENSEDVTTDAPKASDMSETNHLKFEKMVWLRERKESTTNLSSAKVSELKTAENSEPETTITETVHSEIAHAENKADCPEKAKNEAPKFVEPKTTAAIEAEIVTTTEKDSSEVAIFQPETQSKPKSEGGYFARIKQGLAKTRSGFANLFLGKKVLDQDLIDDLEMQLLTADVGIEVTTKIIDAVTEKIDRKELKDAEAVKTAVRDHMIELLTPFTQPLNSSTGKPFVILMTGINGAGKTTTIGKLACHFQAEGKKVMLAAGDTFRAAAVEQLQTWGQRNNVPVIAQSQGADAASVAYDALQSATARGVDVLIIDTAGRLHTQDHLMEELKKIKRVIGKINPEAPHETMLIIDAGNGQNALRQAEHFHKAMDLDGITVTKLDGTAKGGIVFAITEKLGVPIRYIGVGEQVEDLRPFNALEFVNALLYND